MASSKAYLEYILDQLSSLEGVAYRPMMGEYLIYYRGRLVGGVYDDRFLVKPTGSARRLMPEAPLELPYEGGKPMLMADNTDSRELLCALVAAVAEELPEPKKGAPKKKKALPGGKPDASDEG